jgi:5'-phosphate synthase pdxT subunit
VTTIGVLALQGDFAEHVSVLRRLGSEAQEVRRPDELSDLDGLIIPGGESTTITRLMDEYEFAEPLRRLAQDSFPVWGTCAGMIVLARQASDLDWPTLAALDITVRRNAFGRQVDSFETDLSVPSLGVAPFHAVFIRAPAVEDVGEGVEILAALEDGRVVAVRQGNALATAFHPELTDDDRFHRYFLELVRARETETHTDGRR